MNNELYHHGVKGMRWGHRRYQNADGSLTAAGERRYARDAREKGYNRHDSDTGVRYKTTGRNNRRENLDIDAHRYVKEDLTRSKKLADETAGLTRNLKNANQINRNKPKQRMDLSSMTDKEMREKINRELLERQYSDMFSPQKTSKGREYVDTALDVVGSVAAIGASSLAIALAIKELKG